MEALGPSSDYMGTCRSPTCICALDSGRTSSREVFEGRGSGACGLACAFLLDKPSDSGPKVRAVICVQRHGTGVCLPEAQPTSFQLCSASPRAAAGLPGGEAVTPPGPPGLGQVEVEACRLS